MYDYYQPLDLKPESFSGQFILVENNDQIPEGWNRYEKNQWILGVLGLSVLVVENGAGDEIGWCVGSPLNHKEPWAEKITVAGLESDSIDMAAMEKFYEQVSGRYILILLLNDEEKLFLDPYGSLSAVYSLKERKIASTPTFFSKNHDWDREIIELRDMPAKDSYYPLGFTPKKEVRRLLPNHCLDLKGWQVSRHWPGDNTDLAVEDDPGQSVTTIISLLRESLRIITRRHPMQLPLTAGRDSRMLLACSREFIQDAVFHTFAKQKETLDMYISTRLAEQLKLHHKMIPFQETSEEEQLRWLYTTGHCVSGAIWKTHKSLLALESDRVLLNGMSGEVGRTKYWKEGDLESSTLSARELLSRGGYPENKTFLAEMENWLSELQGFNIFNILDLFHVEQRLGCWVGPQHYGCNVPLFEISPFNQRKIFIATMKLPYTYRKESGLAGDICRELWPELLELPFNEYIGYRKYSHRVTSRIKRIVRRSSNISKRVVRKLVS